MSAANRAAGESDAAPGDGVTPPVRPRTFLSYAWTDPDYRQRVGALADRLEDNGVHVVFDDYDLEPGDDQDLFMERMVREGDVSKVLLLCNPEYKRKADGREGGVGTETQIVSRAVYEQGTDQERKYVAVVMECDEDGKAPTPAYYGSRQYLDLSREERAEDEFVRILHFIYGTKPRKRPEPGPAPADVLAASSLTLGTSTRQSAALRALRAGEAGAIARLTDYFETFASHLQRFEISPDQHPETDGGLADLILERTERLKPYRDEAVAVFEAVATYRPEDDAVDTVQRFFEDVARLFDPPARRTPRAGTRVFEWETDPFTLLWEELFLYAVAALLGRQRYAAVYRLTGAGYLFEKGGRRKVHPFWGLQRGSRAIAGRYESNGRRAISPVGNWLRERADHPRVTFERVQEADAVLFLNAYVRRFAPAAAGPHNLRENGQWYPTTAVFWSDHNDPFPVFLRAATDFLSLIPALGAENSEPLREVFRQIERGKIEVPGRSDPWSSLPDITNARNVAVAR